MGQMSLFSCLCSLLGNLLWRVFLIVNRFDWIVLEDFDTLAMTRNYPTWGCQNRHQNFENSNHYWHHEDVELVFWVYSPLLVLGVLFGYLVPSLVVLWSSVLLILKMLPAVVIMGVLNCSCLVFFLTIVWCSLLFPCALCCSLLLECPLMLLGIFHCCCWVLSFVVVHPLLLSLIAQWSPLLLNMIFFFGIWTFSPNTCEVFILWFIM